MFNNIILVFLGGGLGSVLRYLVQRSMNAEYPWGTFTVNIVGCLFIGILWGLFSKNVDEHKRLFFVTGICGGFTTFSTFTYEGVEMLLNHRLLPFITYTVSSVALGLLATYYGFKMSS